MVYGGFFYVRIHKHPHLREPQRTLTTGAPSPETKPAHHSHRWHRDKHLPVRRGQFFYQRRAPCAAQKLRAQADLTTQRSHTHRSPPGGFKWGETTVERPT